MKIRSRFSLRRLNIFLFVSVVVVGLFFSSNLTTIVQKTKTLAKMLGPQIADAQSADLTPEQEAALKAELASIENQIKEQQNILNSKATEGVSIQRDIDILNAKIKKAELSIKAKQLSISNLGKDINVKTNTITALGSRIDKGRNSLAQIIQRTREIDNFSYAEAMLSTENISQFFIDLDSFTSIKQSLQAHLSDIEQAKSQNENVKQQLNTKRSEEIDAKVAIEQQNKIIQQSQNEKKRILTLNKNEQQNYKTSIANNSKRAADIKNQLFKLRDSAAIKFGDAVTYAKAASLKSGTPAAFILAIIQQESNLGANVGSCLLTDPETGAGIRRSSGKVVSNLMKASRDVKPFLSITAALGRDPYKTVVSCPLNIGFGGAMGPAQFIPSTWVLFQDRIANALGKSASDPWNPQDAFMASGFYLSDLGAANGTYTAQRNAACRYYSGRSCNSISSFYGNQVMARVESIQANIDILGSN